MLVQGNLFPLIVIFQQACLAYGLFKGAYSLWFLFSKLVLLMFCSRDFVSFFLYCWSLAYFWSIIFLHLIKKEKRISWLGIQCWWQHWSFEKDISLWWHCMLGHLDNHKSLTKNFESRVGVSDDWDFHCLFLLILIFHYISKRIHKVIAFDFSKVYICYVYLKLQWTCLLKKALDNLNFFNFHVIWNLCNL